MLCIGNLRFSHLCNAKLRKISLSQNNLDIIFATFNHIIRIGPSNVNKRLFFFILGVSPTKLSLHEMASGLYTHKKSPAVGTTTGDRKVTFSCIVTYLLLLYLLPIDGLAYSKDCCTQLQLVCRFKLGCSIHAYTLGGVVYFCT